MTVIASLIGKRIRQLRKEKGLSIEELALDADVNKNYLSDLERGLRNPTILILAKIIDSLEITFAEFFKNI